MPLVLLAVLLPSLFWDRPIDTAPLLRQAGFAQVSVASGQEQAWQKLGFAAMPFDKKQALQAVTPTVEYHADVASATRVPWVDANGWRFAREPQKPAYYDVPAGSAALAAAEAYAYGAHAAIRAAPEDLGIFAKMLQFLEAAGDNALPPHANIGIVDNGSDEMAEVLNLLARHNLLFQIVPAADPKYDLNIRLGTPEYPAADAANPYEFAMNVRHRLTDEKRLARVYGSNVVLVRVTGDGSRARVHLLNYGKATVKGLRVRLLGAFSSGKLSAFEHESDKLEDYTSEDGATEFTIPAMGPYAIVDLRR